jgi:hypothetical protein
MTSVRDAALIAIALCMLQASGCAVGRKWFRMDSESGGPSMGLELRAGRDEPRETVAVRDTADAKRDLRSARQAEQKSRGRFPDWLRLGGRNDPVPLPTTAGTAGDASRPAVTGPPEDFD